MTIPSEFQRFGGVILFGIILLIAVIIIEWRSRR